MPDQADELALPNVEVELVDDRLRSPVRHEGLAKAADLQITGLHHASSRPPSNSAPAAASRARFCFAPDANRYSITSPRSDLKRSSWLSALRSRGRSMSTAIEG